MKDIKLAGIANAIALRAITQKQSTDWASLRDYVDLSTDSDLDCWVLDLLTDMVGRRIQKEKARVE